MNKTLFATLVGLSTSIVLLSFVFGVFLGKHLIKQQDWTAGFNECQAIYEK